MKNLYLREVDPEDIELLYKWVNEPATRENSFNTKNISLEEHRQWFKNALADENIFIFILMLEDTPVGQVRLNKADDVFVITYSIDLLYRLYDYGKLILQLMENKFIEKKFNGSLVGYVKKDNVASQLVFKSLNYDETEETSFYRYEKKNLEIYSIINPNREERAIIFLTNNRNSLPLYDWISENETVVIYSEEIFLPAIKNLNPRLVINYNYNYTINADVENILPNKIIKVPIIEGKVLFEMKDYSLREIRASDLKMLLEWRNSPRISSMMLTDHEITWEEHLRWFCKISKETIKKNFIFYFKDTPIGYCSAYDKFDEKNKTCSPSSYLGELKKAPKDAAIFLYYMGTTYIFEKLKITKFITTIFADNKRVLKLNKLFGYEIDEKNGFFAVKDGRQRLLYNEVLTKERFEEASKKLMKLVQLDD